MLKLEKTKLILLVFPVLALVILVGCDVVPKAGENIEDESASEAVAGLAEPTVLAGQKTPDGENSSLEYAGLISESGEIRLVAPGIDDVINSPVTVAGVARTFENTVIIRIKDGDGNLLAESIATTDAAEVGQFGNFEQVIAFKNPVAYDRPGIIEVFEEQMKDGEEVHKVTIPVGFAN